MDNCDKDNYETPYSALDLILEKIDKTLVIWEPFYCTGRSGEYMKSKGYTVIHEIRDFFTYEPDCYDVIVTNPPYSKNAEVLSRLEKLGKPFSILVPVTTICTQSFTRRFASDFSLVIPDRRVQFIKDGVVQKNCSFASVWVSVPPR